MDWKPWLADPALAAFVPVEAGGARMLVRRGFEAHADVLGLSGEPASPERIRGGREAHPVVALPDGTRAVVRGYRRGGAVRHVNHATYFLGHRAFAELRATERARAGGVRVPVVLAAAERRAGLGYRATLATALIPASAEAARWLADVHDAALRTEMLREAGRQICRMHAAGVAHPDLNLRNLLVVSPACSSADATTPLASPSAHLPPSTGMTGDARPSMNAAPTDADAASEVASDDSRRAIREMRPANDVSEEANGGGRGLGGPPKNFDVGGAARLDSSVAGDSGAERLGEGDGKPGCSSPLVYLLDFDGARIYGGRVPRRRRAANLLRLARSARKLGAGIGADGWAALRAGYGASWPLDRDLG
ncbi:MAG TPA: lipopolysaccharide kinase InaA family protein [Longimicrobiaceae bacterium]|jgi:3-deoxy-D-manno-octulosonic acid kinase|nr:lipopolysaccharide kinase InaA family protein [Longimicrobiaceae bacterium]